MMDIFDQYKNQIENGSEMPPDTVWQNITEHMDINSVWSSIDHQMNYISIITKIKHAAIFVAASALIFFSIYRSTPFYETLGISLNLLDKQLVEPIADKNIAFQQYIQKENEALNNEQAKRRLKNNQIQRNTSNDRILETQLKTTVLDNKINKDAIVQMNDSVQRINYYLNQHDLFSISLVRLSNNSDNPALNQIITGLYNPSIYLGLSSEINNTWLINDVTVHNFQKDELNTTKPTFANSYSVYTGIDFSRSFSLQAEYYFFHQNNQKYEEYINGKYSARKISLNYQLFAFSMKNRKSFTMFTKIRSYRNVVIGFAFGTFIKGKETINQNSKDISELYEHSNFNILAGYEIENNISKNISITYGIRTKVGMMNIWKGSDIYPADLNVTHTTAVGGFVSVKYSFRKY